MIIEIFEGSVIDKLNCLDDREIKLLTLINSNITSGKFAEIKCERDGHHLQILSWKDSYEGIIIEADELEQAMDMVPSKFNVYEFITNKID